MRERLAYSILLVRRADGLYEPSFHCRDSEEGDLPGGFGLPASVGVLVHHIGPDDNEYAEMYGMIEFDEFAQMTSESPAVVRHGPPSNQFMRDSAWVVGMTPQDLEYDRQLRDFAEISGGKLVN